MPKVTKRKAGSKRLYDMSRIITSTLEPKKILETLLKEAMNITGADSGSIMLIRPESDLMQVEVAMHISGKKIRSLNLKIGEGVTGWVAKKGKPLLVPDVKKDRRYIQIHRKVRTEMTAPLIIDDIIIGIINLDSQHVGAFTEDDLELLTTLATHSSKIIQNARLYSDLKKKAEKLSSLFNIGQVMISKVHLDELLNKITEEAVKLTEAKICSLMLVDESGKELKISSVFGGSERYTQKPNLLIRKSLLGKVILKKKPLFVLDVKKTSSYRYPDVAEEEGLCSLLSVPLVFQENAIGVLNIYHGTSRHFSQDEIDVLSALASLSAMAIENTRIYKNIIDAEEILRQRERLTVLGELAAEIAHEIRNPLTVIKMLVASHREKQFSDEQKKDNQLIEDKITHIEKLIEQVLSIGRPGEMSLEMSSIEECLEQTLSLMRFRIVQQHVKLKKILDIHLPQIPIDSGLMSQVFMNLILNALESMPDQGVLTVKAWQEDDEIKIYIKDTGKGIVKEDIQKLFTPFFTSKKDGMGLGLAIVKRIVDSHGGGIQVSSQMGRGSKFMIRLPITSI